MLRRFLYLAVLALVAFAGDAKKTGNVLTTNDKQAAQLQAAAVLLKPGNYKIQNVATGQSIYYVPQGNNVYPTKGKYTPAAVTHYTNKNVAWHRLNLGAKKKCLSSAYGTSGNNAAVMYACASGSGSTKTTLEKTKQYFLFVPVSNPTVATASSNSAANKVLLVAQSDSIATREKKEAALKNAFEKRADAHGLAHRRMVRSIRKRELEKRGIKTVSSGTFYILAVDHLLDRAAALTGKSIKSRGITSTQLTTWKKGTKLQQWKVTRV